MPLRTIVGTLPAMRGNARSGSRVPMRCRNIAGVLADLAQNMYFCGHFSRNALNRKHYDEWTIHHRTTRRLEYIYDLRMVRASETAADEGHHRPYAALCRRPLQLGAGRSEERRVGKACRSR